MANEKSKRTGKEPEIKKIDNPPIDQFITETLETNYMPYAMSVIISRAIPQIDGFKPSHRKLLYTMYKMGLLTKQRMKSLDIVGQTMSLNPHGDGAIYETMVRLTRGNNALLHPFIDSKGNFSKQYSRDMAYAASRYTEVKLDPFCAEIFKDIDKDTVDFIDNYNGTSKEPVLLPTTFPNILVIPTQGIAVGMASSICGFNLAEICKAAIAVIKNDDVDLLHILKAPDFTSGGQLIYNEAEMRNIYETGRGSFKLRGRYRFDKKQSLIEIYEIPYSTTIEAIIDKIILLVKQNKLRDVTEVRDETGLHGLKIAIDIRKSADPDVIMKKIFALTPMVDSFSCNFNILIDGKPKTMGVREILEEWLIFRIECVSRKIRFDLKQNNEKMHLLQGLKKIILDIDKAIKIIRETENEKDVIPNLMSGFSIDEIQAEYVAEIKLRNINKEYLLKRTAELESLQAEIDRLNDILNNADKLTGLIIDELKEIIKKYGRPRMTEIVYDDEPIKLNGDDFVDDYGVKLFLTKHGYFKKISLISLRSSGEQNIKEDDEFLQQIETTNKADILFFSDRQVVYKIKAHEISDSKASGIGDYLPNILSMEDGEKVLFMAATTDYSGNVLFCFENGKMAKVAMNSYQTKMNRKKLINAYSDRAALVFAAHILSDCDLIAFRDRDKALLFNTSLLPLVTSKNSVGIQAMTLKKNSRLSEVLYKDQYESIDVEHYRTQKIPSSGHFIIDDQLRIDPNNYML